MSFHFFVTSFDHRTVLNREEFVLCETQCYLCDTFFPIRPNMV